MGSECKSYMQSALTCADGFVQMQFCSGGAGCGSCGHVAGAHLPFCLRDELPEHMADDAGGPRFYKPHNTK